MISIRYSLRPLYTLQKLRLPKFDYSELAAATNQFSSTHLIGSDPFGRVYKATLRTGRTVAVKRFSSSGPQTFHNFRNQILSISNLQHQNIIRLLGYCIHGNAGMLLYEFMKKGTLDAIIFDEQWCCQLRWSVRFKIIIGIAKGVIYLHQETMPRTMHRDLTPSNILVDEEMNPKISGFSLARDLDDGQSELITDAVRTVGYAAPESYLTDRISEKLDVYSFGVVVLDIMSGRRNDTDRTLIPYVWRKWREGARNVADLVGESQLGEEFPEEGALRRIHVGLLCSQYAPQQCPTMASVLIMLLGEDPSLQKELAQARTPYRLIYGYSRE